MKSKDDKIDTISTGVKLYKVEEFYIEEIVDIINKSSIVDDKFDLRYITSLFELDADTQRDEIDNAVLDVAVNIIKYQHLVKFKPESRLSTFLVFLPGIQEINTMYDKLESACWDFFYDLDICILHTSIPEEEHDKILVPPAEDKRRVILSTNIAESSITLTDVRFIIDFGFMRQNSFNSSTMADNLELV